MNARASIRREFLRMSTSVMCSECLHKWSEKNSMLKSRGSTLCPNCGRSSKVDIAQMEKDFVDVTMKGFVNKLPKTIGGR